MIDIFHLPHVEKFDSWNESLIVRLKEILLFVESLFKGTTGVVWFLIMKLILMSLIIRMSVCSLASALWSIEQTLNLQEV